MTLTNADKQLIRDIGESLTRWQQARKGEPESPKQLHIAGTGPIVRYKFGVTGTLQNTGKLETTDTVQGNQVKGQVSTQDDSFAYTGELEYFVVTDGRKDDIRVTVNGEEIEIEEEPDAPDPDPTDNILRPDPSLEGIALTRSSYEFAPPDRLDDFPFVGGAGGYHPDEFTQDPFEQGAGRPTGNAVSKEDADTVVTTAEKLKKALTTADDGDVVWIHKNADIRLDDIPTVYIEADNVTLASARSDTCEGGRMYLETESNDIQLYVKGQGFRATGFILEGPTMEKWGTADEFSYERHQPDTGISINGDDCEVDNCSIRGWGHAAIEVGRERLVEHTHIHHCDLVDNPATSLGYGVTVFHGNPLIQFNYFDNCRHAIAGDGASDCGYIARYNLFGPRTILHVCDMHPCEVSEDKYIGGKRISVHHNECMATANYQTDYPQEFVKFREVPTHGAEVRYNVVHHPKDRFDEVGVGKSGDAFFLQTEDENPETFKQAGIDVSNNRCEGDTTDPECGIPKELTQ